MDSDHNGKGMLTFYATIALLVIANLGVMIKTQDQRNVAERQASLSECHQHPGHNLELGFLNLKVYQRYASTWESRGQKLGGTMMACGTEGEVRFVFAQQSGDGGGSGDGAGSDGASSNG